MGPLQHVVVLDLSRVMAGPWAAQVLADLGAEVVKVEHRDGDDTRGWGPPFIPGKGGGRGDAAYYLSVNRGKRSITIDMAKPEGRELVLELAARSDIVIENFKVGTLKRYGLDYEAMRQVKADIIYASITGFGQDGPRKDQAAYDFAIQAMGGLMSVTGEADERPGGGPQKVGVPIVDMMTGMYASTAILAALANREKTGLGERIDLALLDVQTAFLANQGMNWLVGGEAPRRSGNRHPNIQPQDRFDCADGAIVLAVGNDRQFAALCRALDREEWTADARFSTNAGRVSNAASLTALLAERMKSFSRAEITGMLARAGVPCGPINTIPEVFGEPQVVHRGMVRHLPHPTAGNVPQIVSPMNFQRCRVEYGRAPPLLGADTDAILRELGRDEAGIGDLKDRGIV